MTRQTTKVDLATQVKGMLQASNGGTGNSGGGGSYPSQTGHANQFLMTNGTSVSWQSLDGGQF